MRRFDYNPGVGTNYAFLRKIQKVENGVGFDWVKDLGYASVCFSESSPSVYQNYALVEIVPSYEQMGQLEKLFRDLVREPAVYFEKGVDTAPIEMMGFRQTWEDSWMFYLDNEVEGSKFDQVKRVTTLKDLDIFITTIDACYQKDDPQNPYGEIKDYLVGIERAWGKWGSTDRLQFFVAFADNEPVATSILNSFDGIGYISGVGSLGKVRGQGFGKLATLYAVEASRRLGNTDHTLATEEGHYPNEFYKRIGFETKFRATGWTRTHV